MPSLFVYMNGYEVGEYTQISSGAQAFHYFDSWLERGNAIPISLSMPLTDKNHKGSVVYNYFDNLCGLYSFSAYWVQLMATRRTSAYFSNSAEDSS